MNAETGACGAPAMGGPCVLPSGHNMGRADVPGAHQAAEIDGHAGCQEAYEQQRRRAEFAEARLSAFVVEFRRLAQRFDSLDGHTAHPKLGNKTLGGAIRHLTSGQRTSPASTPSDGSATTGPSSHSVSQPARQVPAAPSEGPTPSQRTDS